MVPAPRDRLLFSFLTLFVTALACGQAIPAQSGGQPPTSTSPRAEDQTPIEASVAGAPILIGTEYIIIEVPSRVAPLAGMLEPLGLTTAKPLPANFDWGAMQASADAQIDFTRLDNFVIEFQTRGIDTLVLALRSISGWASKDVRVPGSLFPLKGAIKEEYLDEYEVWVSSVVERYDADGVSDMPGLRAPIRYYEIGVEFSSYEPEPVDEYLQILELAYRAAHEASSDVLIAHVAFLATPALFGEITSSEYESAFATLEDQTHPLADMRRILDRPDLFDVLNIHSLGHPYEIEAIVAWLNYETTQRGYQKPIIISDTGSTPFIAWGPATVCDRPLNQMGRLVPPATEADRCRLADYFTLLIRADAATLVWTQEFIAQDTVKRIVVAASQGITLINTAYTEDLLLLKLSLARAGAGTSAWAGLVDLERKEYRPVYYALQQIISQLDNYDRITRLPFDEQGLRMYAVENDGRRSWIAWYDPGILVLPGDQIPQTTLQVDFEISALAQLSLALDSAGPEVQTLSAVDGLITITLTPSPVFIFADD
ncbi:MAG TPA: hypothetical protein VI688_06010 [Anaerolineales bacterium]|nr:hypothetical protein [Anaerolineales bacterium]HLE73778.1 hypothetical protein [Anaerolineales bacterium]